LSPSRSSIASRAPVEAPEGTAARPMTPDSSSTSHSTVGLPRESRISRPMMSTIELMAVCASHALDQDHVEVLGRALAMLARLAVLLGVVEGLGLLVAGEAQH